MVDMSGNKIQSSVTDSLVILFSACLVDFNILRFNLIDDKLTGA